MRGLSCLVLSVGPCMTNGEGVLADHAELVSLSYAPSLLYLPVSLSHSPTAVIDHAQHPRLCQSIHLQHEHAEFRGETTQDR